MRDFSALSLLVSFALSFTACMGSDDAVGRNLGLGAACGASGDCAPNLECEVEHGVASCQPHGGRGEGGASSDAGATASRVLACRVDADCVTGEECEAEHGLRVCRPHHRGASPDAGSTSTTTGCAVDTDCAAGLECEVEHGVGLCQPHRGGRAVDAGSAPVDAGSAPVDAGSAPVDARSAPVDAPAGRGVGGACTVDLDCAAGLECEVEHGVGTCEPHGGR